MPTRAHEESEFVRRMRRLPPESRERFIDSLPSAKRNRIRYTWSLWARPRQLWRPTDRTYTVLLGGRGSGKTRTIMEAAKYVAKRPELCGGVIGIAGRTANDVNRTLIWGESGLMRLYPPHLRPKHWKSDKIIEWRNGVTARLFSGDVPESFRGPNIGLFILDEFAHWSKAQESWDAAKYMLRIGKHVRAIIATTPLPIEPLERLVWLFDKTTNAPIEATEDTPADDVFQGFIRNPATDVITGSTYDNAANLAANFLEEIVAKNEGTELSAQEIDGAILRDAPGAIFKRHWFHHLDVVPDDVVRVIVMVDPAGTIKRNDKDHRKPSEVGIVVMAMSSTGMLYMLEDATRPNLSTKDWGDLVWKVADRWNADAVVAEDNYGKDLVRHALQTARPRGDMRILDTVSATQDKEKRARVVSGMWEVGRVIHVGDSRDFVHVERQMATWDPRTSGYSPDRMDAAVWAAIYLTNNGNDRERARVLSSADTWRAIRAALEERLRHVLAA